MIETGMNLKRDAREDMELYNKSTQGKWELSKPHWHRGCQGKVCKQSIFSKNGTVAVAFKAQYCAWDDSVDNLTQLNSIDGEFIVESHDALPFWIERATEAEELLREVLSCRIWDTQKTVVALQIDVKTFNDIQDFLGGKQE